MRATLSRFLVRLASFLAPRGKGMPFALAGGQWSGTSFVDSYRRNRNSTVPRRSTGMKAKTKTAFSYIRFSDRKQAKGDSLRRQLEWGPALCASKGWALDDGLKLQDLGVSAFRGKNAATGALAAFRAA